jgi:hypothetical protein
MKGGSLVAAISVILIANALALIHAVRNRAGSPEAEVTLTQKELQYLNRAPSDDDSGVSLILKWTDPDRFPFPQMDSSGNSLDQQKLESLGFDCSVKPEGADAPRFYERQRPRRAYVALEYDGPAWQAWFAAYGLVIREQQTGNRIYNNLTESGLNGSSHLVTIDADLDAGKLRARHPDRASVVILPAVVGITIVNFPYPGMPRNPGRPARLRGNIREMSTSIHIARPFSDAFRRLGLPRSATPRRDLLYRVHLRYGASLEPWVTGVEFTNGN